MYMNEYLTDKITRLHMADMQEEARHNRLAKIAAANRPARISSLRLGVASVLFALGLWIMGPNTGDAMRIAGKLSLH